MVRAAWQIGRWALVGLAILGGVWLLVETVQTGPDPGNHESHLWAFALDRLGVLPLHYRYLRHPQYLGLILVIVAFNLQWPTLPTVLMAPVLIVMYVQLARREDADLAARFGQAFLEYAARASGFIPARGPARRGTNGFPTGAAGRWAGREG